MAKISAGTTSAKLSTLLSKPDAQAGDILIKNADTSITINVEIGGTASANSYPLEPGEVLPIANIKY